MSKIQFFKALVRVFWLLIHYGPAKISERWDQAIFDELTGLYNRRFLQEAGKREIARALRAKKEGIAYPISLIFVDIDHFKRINDREGHLAGDKVLQDVAVLLKKYCREVDVVCRFGGDEFAILLPQTAEEGAQVVIDKLKKSAKKEIVSPKGETVEISCGLAREFSLEALKEADAKMYQEKKSKHKV